MGIFHDDANGQLAPVVGLLGTGGAGAGTDLSVTGSATRTHAILQRGIGAALTSEPLADFFVAHYLNSGETDYGAAIGRVATAVTANGGGRIIFTPGTYPIFTAAGGFLASFVGISGIQILAYGAVFVCGTGNPDYIATAGYGAMFVFTDCSNIFVDGLNVTGPDLTTTFAAGLPRGINVLQFVRGNINIKIGNMSAQGVQCAVILPNTLANVGSPNRHIQIDNLLVRQSHYGINGSYGIHGLRVGLLKTENVYRSLPLHADLRDIDVNVWSKNAYGHDIAISALNGHGIDGLRLRYRMDGDSTGPNGGGVHQINIGYGDSTPAPIRNVDIELNIKYATAGAGIATGVGALRFIKTTNGDTADTVDRGHLLDGFRVSGFVKGTPTFTTRAMVSFQAEARFGPTLDRMRNVVFRDLIVDTSLVSAIDWECSGYVASTALNGITDTVVLDNVHAGSSVVMLRDYAASVPLQTTATAKISSIGSTYSNQFLLDATPGAYPIEVRRLSSDSMAIPAAWMTGVVITNSGIATNPHTNALPAALVGRAATFVNEDLGSVAWRLDPTPGTDAIRGASGAGKYIEISAGAVACLRSLSGGIWEVLWTNGTIAFEP